MNSIFAKIAEKISGYLDGLSCGQFLIISVCLNALQFFIIVLVFFALEATFLSNAICHASH